MNKTNYHIVNLNDMQLIKLINKQNDGHKTLLSREEACNVALCENLKIDSVSRYVINVQKFHMMSGEISGRCEQNICPTKSFHAI